MVIKKSVMGHKTEKVSIREQEPEQKEEEDLGPGPQLSPQHPYSFPCLS